MFLQSWLRIILLAGVIPAGLHAQDLSPAQNTDCTLFGPRREAFTRASLESYTLSARTERVAGHVPDTPGRQPSTRLDNFAPPSMSNLIDRHTFAAFRNAAVRPAPRTTDFEFIRRVTLDLTGRVPTLERLAAFIADTRSDKRDRLVDELLASPEWLDKWTVYFGDHLKNTQRNTQVTMFPQGRDAFQSWIKDALASRKPYDQMAREIIASKGDNSFNQAEGPVNWLVGGRVTGGPVQDIWDQQTANISETFLGIAHLNCLLCHNGRGHLTTLSLWGGGTTRNQAEQMASFLSHSETFNTRPDPTNANLYYWSVADDLHYKTDYPLNTTTGNRPARQPIGTVKSVAPVYLFNGKAPTPGSNYRDALAREVTADPQFARAAVNYLWEQFFGRGIVNPSNQFDPARLDPDHPPPDPWTLQPSNPWLLRDLAQNFVDSKFDIKGLQRLIVTSETYQLSALYPGHWNPAWEPLFARKLVRRLWAEEIMDAVAQTSGIAATYTLTEGKLNWAMQAPEPLAIGGNFMTSFLPGNRDDEPRRDDGSLQQGLNMMNDTFVLSRTRATGAGLAARALKLDNAQAVSLLYLTVLSRSPSAAENSAAIAALSAGNRSQKMEDLLWSLYNKVDFIFNY